MDEATLEIVRDWLTRASHDLYSARVLADSSKSPLDTAIYHCQQAAEKAAKAYLQARDEPFAWTPISPNWWIRPLRWNPLSRNSSEPLKS